jgi:serine/threonine-protein kinase
VPPGDTQPTPAVASNEAPTVVEPISEIIGEDLQPTLAALPDASAAGSVSGSGTRELIGRDIIGQYVIRSKLGEGGMGEVYLAEQPAIGRKVAIKVVHANLLRGLANSEGIERFRNEAKAAARLESPHIVQIYNWGELDDGTLFMAMEYLSGVTLAGLLRQRKQLEPELAVHIATQICAALTEAHAAGIVHRDLKPSNIMLIERGGNEHFAKVLDFGVAKLEGADITRSGALFGTPQYMSPEQLQAGHIDGRSDLYALGVILFELLAGKPPFVSSTAIGFITLHLNEPPPQLPKTVPRALAAVIARLLAKDPDERPRDAALAAEELRAALAGRAPRASAKQRKRALRGFVNVVLVSALLAGVGVLGWAGWQQWQSTHAALEHERERAADLEHALAQESANAKQAREDARLSVEQTIDAGKKARAERDALLDKPAAVDKRELATLSAEHRKLLQKSRSELVELFEDTLANARLPPSEVASIQATYRDNLATMSDDDLRSQLVNLISIYQKVERLQPGDRLSLTELEQVFLTMVPRDTLTLQQREEMLSANRAEHESIPEVDREFLERLSLARLIRKHALDPRLIDRARKPNIPPPPPDAPPTEPPLPGTRDKDGKDGKDGKSGDDDGGQNLPAPGDEGPVDAGTTSSSSGDANDTLDQLPGLDE